MSGIGISHCPPFSNRAGLPPGILWDGNTVAWYKHNDMRTVFQDGANRVNHWLDRMGYAIGADIMAGWDFTAGWAAGGGAVIVDANTFTGAIVNDFIRAAAYPLVANTTYRVTYSWQITAGANLLINDFNNATTYNTFAGNGAVQAGQFCFTTAVAPAGVGISLAVNGGMPCQIDIFQMIIEPIAGNHLLQNTAADQSLHSMADGMLFDGVNDYMQTLAFVYNQPEMIYFVGRQILWANSYISDGDIANRGAIYQRTGAPIFGLNAGAGACDNNNLPLNIFGIVRVLFNGAASFTQVNQTAAIIGNPGAANMGGFVLGARGNPHALWVNIEVKEIILRSAADGAGVQQQIYDYLRAANGCG